MFRRDGVSCVFLAFWLSCVRCQLADCSTHRMFVRSVVTFRVAYANAMWFCFTPQQFISQGGLLAVILFALRYLWNPAYDHPDIRGISRSAFAFGAGTGDVTTVTMVKIDYGHRTARFTCPLVECVSNLPCTSTSVAREYDLLVRFHASQGLGNSLCTTGNNYAFLLLPADHSPHHSTPNLFTNASKNTLIFACLKEPFSS